MESKPAPLKRSEIAIFAASLILAASMFIILGSQLNIGDSRLAYDWKILWHTIEDGHIIWGEGMFSPPWTMFFLLPLGFVPLEVGWGLMMFLLLVVLIVSVPSCTPRWRQWLGVVLLVTCYLVMRGFADSNLEAVALGSVLLMLTAYERRWPVLFGWAVLMATIKPQITYLLLLVAVLYLFQTSPRAYFLKVCAVILVILVPAFIWQGRPWLDSLTGGSFDYGISIKVIWSALPAGVILALQGGIAGASLLVAYVGDRHLSHPKAALLIAASLLAAPFSNTHSIILVLALGVVPLMLSRPWLGGPLFLLYEIPYLGLTNLPLDFDTTYWNVVLIITWAVLLGYVYFTERVSVPGTDVVVASAS
jgi:hypothetical protein